MSSSDAAKPVVIDDADVKKLLMEHEFLEAMETGEGENRRVRVRCELTQHEMLPRKDAIETHLKSKKFVKAKEWYCYDYSKYEPYIVAHRRKPKSLFCNVTNTVLNRIPSEVEKHVSGKKFLRLKEHVKFTERKSSEKVEGGDENEGEEEEDDFDANAFEFENAQVLLSDDEDEGNAGVAVKGAGKKTKKPQNDSDDDDDDNDEDEEDEEEVYEDDDDEEAEDSDMAEFYPDDEDDDEGRLDHETILKLAAEKKRKAADGEDDGAKDADKKGDVSSKQPAAKKQKKAPKPVSKARISSKDRRQQPKQQKASFKK